MIKYLIKVPLLKRIIPSIYKKYIFNKNFYKKIIVDDVIFDLDLRHLIDRRFFFHKSYENELFLPIIRVLESNKIDYFLDIGSCWGIYSLRLAKKFKNLKILSFDPIKNNISRLKKSIKKNKIKNIKIFKTALGSSCGEINLGATESYSPNYKINETNSVITEICKVNVLDKIFKKNKKFIIIKIDTEEFELNVLKGSVNVLKNNNCYVQIEICSKNKRSIFNFFKKIKYKQISLNKKNKSDYLFSNFIFNKIEI